MTPRALLTEARRLVHDPDHASDATWPRAAAFLTRQALEHALREVLIHRYRLAGEPSFRAQLLAAQAFLPEPLARRAAWSWTALSAATHHHGYSLAPTGVELDRWMGTVEEVLDAVEGRVR